MATYFQMGHDSENLVGKVDLEEFKGMILSPINREPHEMRTFIPKARKVGVEDVVLDPQFYFPRAVRGKLGTHSYFPKDFDTADYSSDAWWAEVVGNLCKEGSDLEVDAIATPTLYPKQWNDGFWARSLKNFQEMKTALQSTTSVRPICTVFVSISAIQSNEEVLRLASMISDSEARDYLIILVTDVEPRREILDSLGLCGAMQLIHLLSQKAKVTVSHSGSDVLLFKVAGASNCATGKFFNLRRFTTARFDESEKGGGQIPYWFEPNLLGFLREADVLRLKRNKLDDLLADSGFGNVWTAHIELNLAKSPPEPWLSPSWKQYLSSFAKIEKSFSDRDLQRAGAWLQSVENNWKRLDSAGILMDEQRNDGRWIRPWRQALQEFRTRTG